ncbi:MAG: heparan-alpha-glucosaminide N-acetyltransferase domain-containing protein [Planctomycetota bacterium]
MSSPPGRIAAYDVARGLAILGMIVVNFDVSVGASGDGPPIGAIESLAKSFQGRAAALFVVLAGVGLSLLSRKAREGQDPVAIGAARTRILRRAAFFLVVGLCYLPLWPGDILHYYGVYFVFGALMITWSNRALWAAISVIPALFVGLLIANVDYERHWDWTTLTYEQFWTVDGLIRNTFFNGFHPVLPWLTFLVLGMWIGRRTWSPISYRVLAFSGIAIMAFVDIFSENILAQWIQTLDPAVREDLKHLLGTASIPPGPLYVLAAGAGACGVIGLSMVLVDRLGEARLTPLISTGQLAFTHYVGHVIIGLGTLEAMGYLEPRFLPGDEERRELLRVVWIAAAAYGTFAIVTSWAWRARFRHGPLEWVLRRIAG